MLEMHSRQYSIAACAARLYGFVVPVKEWGEGHIESLSFACTFFTKPLRAVFRRVLALMKPIVTALTLEHDGVQLGAFLLRQFLDLVMLVAITL
jgi:hypothetical protein